jgi:hypothetical protein
MSAVTNAWTAIAVMTLALVRPMAQPADDLQRLDRLPIDISETDFTKTRPDATRVSTPGHDARSTYFIYTPKGLTFFGLPVATVGRGFESGRGCSVGFGFATPTAEQSAELVKSAAAAFRTPGQQRTDSSGNEWWYFESPALLASAMASPSQPDGQSRSLTFAVSSRSCDPVLAATRWQTRPR